MTAPWICFRIPRPSLIKETRPYPKRAPTGEGGVICKERQPGHGQCRMEATLLKKADAPNSSKVFPHGRSRMAGKTYSESLLTDPNLEASGPPPRDRRSHSNYFHGSPFEGCPVPGSAP